jgi:hypothetical protein
VKIQDENLDESMVLISKKEYDNLQFTIGNLSDQLSELKRMIFGSKSERFVLLR